MLPPPIPTPTLRRIQGAQPAVHPIFSHTRPAARLIALFAAIGHPEYIDRRHGLGANVPDGQLVECLRLVMQATGMKPVVKPSMIKDNPTAQVLCGRMLEGLIQDILRA